MPGSVDRSLGFLPKLGSSDTEPGGSGPEAASVTGADDPLQGTAYARVSRIGGGGMGEVLLARHLELDCEFVVKLLRTELGDDPRTVDRMRIEAEALGRLCHRNIVDVTDFGHTRDGRPFIVMERLRGLTLDRSIAAHGAFELRQALMHTRSLLSALAAAHAIGIVHRDIKPQNLLLQELAGGGSILKVLDFGMARVLPGASSAAPLPLSVPTETGLLLGTPRFVSPEAAAGRRVDERADLYAAGLMLYLMLAGRGPFDHLRRLGDLLEAHAALPPEPPSRYRRPPQPPAGASSQVLDHAALAASDDAALKALDRAVLKALEKRPEDRFQSAHEFEAVLRLVEHELGLDRGPELRAGASALVDTPRPGITPGSAEACESSSFVALVPALPGAVRSPSVAGRPLLALSLFAGSLVVSASVSRALTLWLAPILGGLP